MLDVELVLCNPQDESLELRLYYDFLDTPIAQKQLACLRNYEKNKIPFFETDRFQNFPNDYRDKAWVANELNKVIDTINEYAPGTITHRAHKDMGQETLNILHHYFEVHRGGIRSEGLMFKTGPVHVKKALEQLNLLVHRFESLNMDERDPRDHPWAPAWAIMTFGGEKHLLADEDYEHFTLRSVFGSWSIDYCEVGKQIWDLYFDEDEIVGDDNVRPLRYYSGDSLLRFGPSQDDNSLKETEDKFYKWWDENVEKLRALGFEKGDKKNSIGYIPVANLNRKIGAVRGLSEEEIVHLIGRYQRFKSVHVLDL